MKVSLVALPPAEAVEYFRQKGFAIGFDYRDVWQAQHQAAFTVAKVMQQDLLEEIRKSVDAALGNGTTYGQFAKGLTPALINKGWWGRKTMTDPLTGEVVEVQLGSPNRLKTIYDTNLRTAHSEGQWQRIQDNKDAFPYLQYDANNSAHHRAEHSAWDGLILPVDHPFFRDHLPVKEYKCKCRVIPRTAKQVQDSGRAIGPAPVVPTMPYVNPRTGDLQHIPRGVHPSFYYPPGGRRASLNRHLVERLESAAPDVARASIAELVSGQAFSEWYRRPSGAFALAHLDKAAAVSLGARTQLVGLSQDILVRQLREQPQITVDTYSLVQLLLDQGTRYPGDTNDTWGYWLEEADGQILTIDIARQGNDVLLTRLQRLNPERARQDKRLAKVLTLKKP